MATPIKPLIDQYKLHHGLLDGIFKGIEEKDFLVRPEGKVNSLQWLLGHITLYRYRVAKRIGVDEALPWAEDLFESGQELKPVEAFPALPEIRQAFDRISEKLTAGLESLPEERLQEPVDQAMPLMEPTIQGTLTFLTFHEAGHIGQMMYARKLLGYDRAFI
jgi:uncharacterized damage-inducible protein DinB